MLIRLFKRLSNKCEDTDILNLKVGLTVLSRPCRSILERLLKDEQPTIGQS